jgi:glycosyltransferase involved in cell wall biosynthesis
VDTDFFMSQNKQWHKKNENCTPHGYVVVGRQTAYKRIDLAVQACTQLGLPLLVIGDGPQHKALRTLAGPTVFFKTDASREDIAHALCSAKGFIFPGLDDFGIAPVEALASGTPVLAYKAGGALDYVAPGKSGDFFDTQSVDCLVDALHRFDQKKYSSDDIKNTAKAFSNEKFDSKLITYLQEKL